MIPQPVHRRALVLLLVAVPILSPPARGLQVQQAARAQVLDNVNRALASDSSRFTQARQDLERSLAACPARPAGRECRILYRSGLGSLLYRQAGLNRRDRDSLFVGAVAHYDSILMEAPDNSEAIYGKALSYRALGPHEWMEPFFKAAPDLDPGRRGLYYTFQGDYFAAEKLWDPAARAYTRAVQEDPDDDGARAGLIEALAALGPSRDHELLRYARDWEPRYPGSAADAYRTVLASNFADKQGDPDPSADTAMVGLVRMQARGGRIPGEVPVRVSTNWTPRRELREFLSTLDPYVAPWWRNGEERTETLAQAALAAGRAAVTEGKYGDAERTWIAGVRLPRPTSTVAFDLQRELALLYFRHPELDPEGRKFNALEQEIFAGKTGALAAGDLEAAQRYHTVLALIYVERGIWKGRFAHNAQDQLTWALEKAEERWQREKFYQPLPELRVLLARGLDSLGSRASAGRRYAEAAAAFLDTDELAAADSATRKAIRLGASQAAPKKRMLALRSALAGGEAGATEACADKNIANTFTSGRPDFLARQQFKVLADCARLGPPNRRREHAISAFRLVDQHPMMTLVGGGDLARFERVMTTLLGPFGVPVQAGHLDRAPLKDGPVIRVSLPGEPRPLWNTVPLDDVIAARVVAELGSSVEPFPIAVSGGVLSVPPAARVPPGLLVRIKGVPGVRAVHERSY